MKIITLLILSSFVFNSFAQQRKLKSVHRQQMYAMRFTSNFDLKRELTSIHFFNYNPKQNAYNLKLKESICEHGKKKKYTEISQFNSFGYKTFIKGEKYETKYVYKQDSILVSKTIKLKNKLIEHSYTYNISNQVTEIKIVKNSELASRSLYIYTSEGKRLSNEVINYKNKKVKSSYKLEYTYDEKGKISFEKYYENGNLKRSWDYTCKDSGAPIADASNKILATESVCKYEEAFADGSYKIYSRRVEQGEIMLNVSKFSKDSVIVSIENFKNDSVLTYRFEYAKNQTVYKYFNKKGQISNQLIQAYDDNHNLIESYNLSKKGKKRYSQILAYNDKKMLTKSVGTGGYTRNYTYVFYE